jgi:hypothetical protein
MDPVTMALLVMAAGKLFKGITSFIGGNSAAKAAEAAALQARQEAGAAANIALDEGERVSASAAVSAAGSGGGLIGSTLSVLEDLGIQSMHNARSAIYSGETEGRRFEYQGRVAKVEGRNALISSAFDAGSTVLGGMGQQAQAQRAAGAASARRTNIGFGHEAAHGAGY